MFYYDILASNVPGVSSVSFVCFQFPYPEKNYIILTKIIIVIHPFERYQAKEAAVAATALWQMRQIDWKFGLFAVEPTIYLSLSRISVECLLLLTVALVFPLDVKWKTNE